MLEDKSFWDFSVRTYRIKGVPDACLRLQDERDVDVNVLLFCLWFAAGRGVLSEDQFQKTYGFSRIWADHVVAPLRVVRTWMKHEGCPNTPVDTEACMDMREKVKAVEFNGEKIQEDTLEAMVADVPETRPDAEETAHAARANVGRYFKEIGVTLDTMASETMGVIAAAAYPHMDKNAAAKTFAP